MDFVRGGECVAVCGCCAELWCRGEGGRWSCIGAAVSSVEPTRLAWQARATYKTIVTSENRTTVGTFGLRLVLIVWCR